MKTIQSARNIFQYIFSTLLITVAFCYSASNPRDFEFIRAIQDDSSARLQTAITRYEKNGISVDLVGAIHIADKVYYDNLNKRFEQYDSLLFEMVGGEKFGCKSNKKAGNSEDQVVANGEHDKAAESKMEALRKAYKIVASMLGLTCQKEQIQYDKPNFVHADLTEKQFTERQKERSEDLFDFATKEAKLQDGKNEKQPNSEKILQAMLTGNCNQLKLELIETMGESNSQINSMTGESAILTDRNTRCMEVLREELAAGRKNIGIFYGAAHFGDLSKQLEQMGFKLVKQEWLTAWNVPKAAKPALKTPTVTEKKPAA